jgi:Ser/Thr protein kinase RdoA (MazF antagonist)
MLLSGDMQAQFHDFDQGELKLIEPLRAMRVVHFNAWLARRWDDPAFPMAFPWFNSPRYWSEYILELKELLSALQLPPVTMPQI